MMALLLLEVMVPLSSQIIPSLLMFPGIQTIPPPACPHWCKECTLTVRGVTLGFRLCWQVSGEHQLIITPPHLYSPEIRRKMFSLLIPLI